MAFFQRSNEAVLEQINHLFDTVYRCSSCKSVFKSKANECPRCHVKFTKVVVDPIWVEEMGDYDCE